MASRISISPGVLRRVTLVGEGASAMGYLLKERRVCCRGNMGMARNSAKDVPHACMPIGGRAEHSPDVPL